MICERFCRFLAATRSLAIVTTFVRVVDFDFSSEMAMTTFFVDQEFSSFKEVESAIEKYGFENNCYYSVMRSDSSNDDVLKYTNLNFVCKHFGLPRDNPNCLGLRPKQSTYKIGCESMIRLTACKKKRKLIVRKLCLEHNHPCTEETVQGYPERRRLSAKGVEKTKGYLQAKVIPSIIRPLLREEEEDSGKLILGKDISNIRTKARLLERNGRSDEEMLQAKIDEIRLKDPEAYCKILYDQDTKEIIFLLIQTSDMRKYLTRYPEVLLMDVTYKINKNRMPVCIMEVMDGDGLGQEVCYVFLANELKPTLSAAFKEFIECSGKEVFAQTQCVVVDKDFSEIGALREAFSPDVVIHICSVHTEKNFKLLVKGLSNHKALMVPLKAMIYSADQEEFEKNYCIFQKIASGDCLKKFQKNWLGCREAWSLKDRTLVMTLRNHTTNRVESLNQKLKFIFNVDTCLYEAVSGVVKIIQKNKKDDKLYRLHLALTKRVKINNCSDPIIQTICNDLSDFAAKIVCEQVFLLKRLSEHSPALVKYPADMETCTCDLFKTLRVPCQHIMFVRKSNGLPIYCKDIVLKRWYRPSQLEPEGSTPATCGANEVEIPQPRMPAEPVANFLGPRQKFHKVTPVTQNINTIVSESGTPVFYRRLQVLNDVLDYWSKGTEVVVVPVRPNQHSDNDNDLVVLSDKNNDNALVVLSDKNNDNDLVVLSDKNREGEQQAQEGELYSGVKCELHFNWPNFQYQGEPAVEAKQSSPNKTPQKSSRKTSQNSPKKTVPKSAKTPPKKTSRTTGQRECVICGRNGAILDCAVCVKPVHAYACSKYNGMMSLICASCQGECDTGSEGENSGSVATNPVSAEEQLKEAPATAVPYKLVTVKTKGRPRAKNSDTTDRWNFKKVTDNYIDSDVKRQERGLKIKDADVTEVNSTTWLVKSQTTKGLSYKVTKSLTDFHCDCPDWVTQCKHILKVIDYSSKDHSRSLHCCACKKKAGNHRCHVCKNVVHEITPCSTRAPGYPLGIGQPRVCSGCQKKESTNAPTSHTVEKPTVAPQTSQNGNGKGCGELPAVPYCCICKKVAGKHTCVVCQKVVHAIIPCSFRATGPLVGQGKPRVCASCPVEKPNEYRCKNKKGVGCGALLVRQVCKGVSNPENKGRVYYGCLGRLTPNCKRFLFWARTEDETMIFENLNTTEDISEWDELDISMQSYLSSLYDEKPECNDLPDFASGNSFATVVSESDNIDQFAGGVDISAQASGDADASTTMIQDSILAEKPICNCGDHCGVRLTMDGRSYYTCWKEQCGFVKWITPEEDSDPRRNVTVRKRKVPEADVITISSDSETDEAGPAHEEDEVKKEIDAFSQEEKEIDPFSQEEMASAGVLSSTINGSAENSSDVGIPGREGGPSPPNATAEHAGDVDVGCEGGEGGPSPPKRPKRATASNLPSRLANSYHMDSLTDSMD